MSRIKVKGKFGHHSASVKSVDFHPTEPWILTSMDSGSVRIWNYRNKTMHESFEDTELPGSEDGYLRMWHSTTYRLECTFRCSIEAVWAVSYLKGSRRVAIGCELGIFMVELGREVPVASMDNSRKIIWSKHNEIHTVNIKSVGADYDVSDGERLPLAAKELGTCDFYPKSLKHSPNGRFVVVYGDGEYIIYAALSWRIKSFGSALEFAWSAEGEYAVMESTSRIKIYTKNFQWRFLLHGC